MRFMSTSQVLILHHRIGKSRNLSKNQKTKKKQQQKNKTKTIVRFINRKYAKKALINRKGLININKSSPSMLNSENIFVNENLTPMKNKIAFHCRKLKRNGQIDNNYSRDGVIHIASSNIRDGKVIKILHMSMLLDICY